MTNEKTYRNLKEWYNDQTKEVKYAAELAIVTAVCLFAMGIDSLMVSVGNFICGILIIFMLSLVCALCFLVIYWIAAAIAPKKTEKIFNALTKVPKDL